METIPFLNLQSEYRERRRAEIDAAIARVLDTAGINRRSFLFASTATIGVSALSYGTNLGANDRISLGHIGVGRRGRELAGVITGGSGDRGNPESPLRWTCRIVRYWRRNSSTVRYQTVAELLHARDYSLQANQKTLERNQIAMSSLNTSTARPSVI